MSARGRPLVLAAVAAAAVVLSGCAAPATTPAEAPAPLHPEVDAMPAAIVRIATGVGEEVVAARVAATPPDRQRGLMGVPDLPDGTGMLFLFEDDRDGGFWMKDTLVPLDIAFVDAGGRIVEVLAMDPCEDDPCPVYRPSEPYRTALEVPQGWFGDQGVAVGDEVHWTEPEPDDRSS